MDFSSVMIQEDATDADGDLKELIGAEGASPKTVPPIWSEASILRNAHQFYLYLSF